MALNDYLLQQSDEDLDGLAERGQLSPETVNAIKAQRAPMMQAPPVDPVQAQALDSEAQQVVQAAGQGTPAGVVGPTPTQTSNLDMYNTAPKATSIVNSSLDAAGLQPASVPTPWAPPQAPPQVDPETQAALEQEAAVGAARQTAGVKAQANAAAKMQEDFDKAKAEHDKEDAATEAKVKADMDANPSIGASIAQAIAIMLGATSQGLTGAKENPAIVAIDKQLEREAARKKYTQEQKDKQMELALKRAQFEIEKAKATVDNMATLRKLEQTDEELRIKRQELVDKKSAVAGLNKLEYTPDEMVMLPPSEEGERIRKRLVRMPNGNFKPVTSAEAKAKVDEMVTSADTGINSGKKLMKKMDYFGNNPLKKLFSREEIGETRALVQDMVGLMRIPYTGPGAFTDTEQSMMKKIVGDPTIIGSLDSANRAKLRTVIGKFELQKRSMYRQNGIDLPLTRNETMLEQLKQKYPKAPETELVNTLVRKGLWKDE